MAYPVKNKSKSSADSDAHTDGHKARKRFGQNFLHDQLIIDNIVNALNPKPEQALLEIGPGLGALTVPVLQRCKHLRAIELDRDVIPILEQKTQALGQLTIISADALKIDLRALAQEHAPGEQLRIYGNLPYNISTPLLFHFFSCIDVVSDMLFMLQKEVVERMAATHEYGDYGRLSVMVQYYCRVEHLFNVPAESFRPAPKVESAIVRLVPHRTRPLTAAQEKFLSQLVASAFSARRKTLRNALQAHADSVQIAACGINEKQRPENLSVQDYVRLAQYLCPSDIAV